MAGSSNTRPLRPRPDEFEVVFVERGRLECESHFRAGRNTITRWLKEAGKARLLKKRSQFVAENRRMERARTQGDKSATRAGTPKKTRGKAADPRILERAAAYLRMKPHGSWVVYEDRPGEWILGTMRVGAAEVLARAKGKGFDAAKAARQLSAFDKNGR